jgi:hypothetical protein
MDVLQLLTYTSLYISTIFNIMAIHVLVNIATCHSQCPSWVNEVKYPMGYPRIICRRWFVLSKSLFDVVDCQGKTPSTSFLLARDVCVHHSTLCAVLYPYVCKWWICTRHASTAHGQHGTNIWRILTLYTTRRAKQYT